MNGEERRNQIVDILKHSSSPVPGTQLAQILDVSRQVIVQDIALIRAKNIDVFSTNRGYVLNDKQEYSRILKVKHEDDEVEAELGAIVDMGGWIRDVFVYHKVYGVIRAEMNIHSRRDIRKYLEEIANGKSSLLMNVTSGYHYHTIVADDENWDFLQNCRSMSLWISGIKIKIYIDTSRQLYYILKVFWI